MTRGERAPREARLLRKSRASETAFKWVAFRVAAVLIGLSPVVLCEAVLRVLDWGRPSHYEDPFVGFSAVHPLFVLDKTQTRYEIAPARLTHFRPDSFAAAKPPDKFRIFCLGGSTVQGRPYSIETSFTTWLELNLQAADPGRNWEVVNCGGVSYATYRLVPILQEVLDYQPDLIIFYEGHNEFLEDRTYGKIKRAPALLAWPHEQVSRLRMYTLLRAGIQQVRGKGAAKPQAADEADGEMRRPMLAPEVNARLDWRGGMADYHRDYTWQRDVISHFEFNLRRAVEIAREARVPLVLVNPVSNLDWPPFKVEHRAGMSAADLEQFDSLLESAGKLVGRNPSAAVPLFRQALALDDQHAGAWYELGKCEQAMGLFSEARTALLRAKDLDVCPLRILQPMNDLVLRVARETATPLVDADGLFTSKSRGGIPGDQWLVDHVHPSIEGHQVLANALADELARLEIVHPVATWSRDRDRKYAEHLAGLDTMYFLKGAQRLRNEQGWAHGRAQKQRGGESEQKDPQSK